MRYRIGVKIAIIDLQAIDLAGEAGDHGGRQLAGHGVVAKHAGVEMQKLHGSHLCAGWKGRGGPADGENDRLLQRRDKGD
ncbi:hypothetical protein G6F35_018881 [Rhizopus arrhizus]|nr:hypothetical protein G6F35_018881 [Rhizopus arrhizus]